MSLASECDFQKALYDEIKGSFAPHVVETGRNLLYSVVVDGQSGTYRPAPDDLDESGVPKLGRKPEFSAFQTDIMVTSEGRGPRVVLELKWNSGEPGGTGRGLNTDGILAYSAKAHRHKLVYPYLRYGVVVGNNDRIGEKFFAHAGAFDFAVTIRADGDRLNVEDLEHLRCVLRDQIIASEFLASRREIRSFSSRVDYVDVARAAAAR